MTEFLSLHDAIAAYVPDASTIALEASHTSSHSPRGESHPSAQRENLTLVRMTPDIIYDQLIGWGARAAGVLVGGNPGVGSLHRLRDAVENEWPRPLDLEEHSHAGHGRAYAAGAARAALCHAARLHRCRSSKHNARINVELSVHR